MDKWILAATLAALVTAWMLHRRTKRTLDTIGQMLDEGAEGTYTEAHFNESRLSALETKFAHYLSASAISARNVAAEKDKIKTLIADISHQTKTPIANLQLYAELLAEEDLPEDVLSQVDAIRVQAEKLHFLIDSLVKLSRLENGILTLSPRQGPVQPMLSSLVEQYGPQARQRGLELGLKDTPARACFDPKWTAEALGNLVDNAIKYTASGSVTISAVEYQMFTCIQVRDTGVGISEEEQPKVFARFYRSEATRDSEGVGIGLFLAREIISGQGGYIHLTSQPGQGSTFSVFLPR